MRPAELVTLRDFLRWAVSRFNAAGLHFGHGTSNAFDEAAWLILHALHLPLDRLEPFLDAALAEDERDTVFALLEQRIDERIPAAYLTGEAWLGEHRFRVDPRVIIPRSHLAGLLADGSLDAWIADPTAIAATLDLCTGSGCLAVLLALTFPHAAVDAIDLSADALAVAAANVADYALDARIRLLQSDLFAALGGEKYDLILSNPPYVTAQAMDALPAEYRHEPALALAAGEDGLDIVRRILNEAGQHLTPHGLLVVEVGDARETVEAAFPSTEFIWLDAADGAETVFVLRADQLGIKSGA